MLEGFSHTRPDQPLTAIVNKLPLPLSKLQLRCVGVVVEVPYTHCQRRTLHSPQDVFVAGSDPTNDDSPTNQANPKASLNYLACVLVSRLELQQYGEHLFSVLGDTRGYNAILRRINLRTFVDVFCYLPDNPLGERITRHSGRMSAQQAPTEAFPHGLLHELAAVAPVWAHPADAALLSQRRLGGRSGRRLTPTLSAVRNATEQDGGPSSRLVPMPLIPLLKAGPVRMLHTRKQSRMPTPPGTTSEVLSLSIMAVQGWVSLWQGGHLLSLMCAVREHVDGVRSLLRDAVVVSSTVQQQEACEGEAASLLEAYRRLAVTVEMPQLQIIALVWLLMVLRSCGLPTHTNTNTTGCV